MSNEQLPLADRSTLQDRVCATIRKAILQGIYAPEEHLRQEDLAKQLGVSRMPVREALKQLEKEGLVTIIPHKGAIVCSITIEDIKEIYELRTQLEPMAAEISFPLLTKEDITQLKSYIKQMEKSLSREDIEYFCELNHQFHEHLLSRCHWKRVQQIVENLWNGFSPYAPSVTGHTAKSMQEHREIVNYIEEKKYTQAVRCLKEHIRYAGESLITYIQERPNLTFKDLVVQDHPKM